MVFITRYLKNVSLSLFFLATLLMAQQVEAIISRRAEAEVTLDGQLSVNTRFQMRLTPTLSDALEQGVALPFRLEFQLTKPRWTAYYLNFRDWFDLHAQLGFKLSYQSLTNRYRVTIGNLSNYYPTLREALGAVGAIQGWRVLNLGTLDPRASLRVAGQVRLLLDISELPRPFQLNALGSAEWSLSSDWVKLDVKDCV